MADDEAETVNVRVAVRCRPMSGKEVAEGSSTCVEFPTPQQVTLTSGTEKHSYAFDHVFSPGSPQENVFEALGVELLDKAFQGYNSTIFAYGQTGSGKTHTMLSHRAAKADRGLIPRIADNLYDRIAKIMDEIESRRFLVCCSFLEIYNEIIYDLLLPRNKQTKGGLEVREQKGVGVYVKDLTEMVVESSEKLNSIIEQGFDHRAVAATKMNDSSSRSHCIFIIKLHQKDAEDETKNTFSKLNLVDLAGSERAKSTEAQGDRLKEGANINKSLSALGNVINALSSIASGNKKVFIPYRNSKLTRVLQESLGGNALCTMVATMSPSLSNVEETLSTLNYAKRAKTIKVTAVKNDEASQVKKLEEEVAALRRKLESQAGNAEGAAMSSKEKAELETKFESQIAELQGFMKTSWDEKQRLSEQYEEDQKRMREEAQRAADQFQSERRRRLQMLEKNGDIQLTMQALTENELGGGVCRGWPEKISDVLRLEQQLRTQLHALKLYRESAGGDFQMCESCKVTDAVAIQTLLSQVGTKLKSMAKELQVLIKLEHQLEEQVGQITPKVAMAIREAMEYPHEEQHTKDELVELLGLIERQLAQHHAKLRLFSSGELQKLGLEGETKWLLECLQKDSASEDTKRTQLLKGLRDQAEKAHEDAEGGSGGGVPEVLGLSNMKFADDNLAASSNAEFAKFARLLQVVAYGGWCPKADDPEEYLELNFGEERSILGLSVQGRIPCSSEWMQTRDLLQLAMDDSADRLPTAEKVFKRPPVRLLHDVGIALIHERGCFKGKPDSWEIPPELVNYADLSREQKVSFFQDLIHYAGSLHPAVADGTVAKLTVTPQDILSGKNCDESNRLLQMLAYHSLGSKDPTGSMFDIGPQWTKSWKLKYFTDRGGWVWYNTTGNNAEPYIFEGNKDANTTKYLKLPKALAASKVRIHPVEWQRHAALRCEIHVTVKEDMKSVTMKDGMPKSPKEAPVTMSNRTSGDLREWVVLACTGIEEVKRGIEERQRAKLKEEEAQRAEVSAMKDKAEQERDILEAQLQEAQRRAEEFEKAHIASEERAVQAETSLLQTQVERDRLVSQTEQLEADLAARTDAKAGAEDQLAGLQDERVELQAAVDDLTSQLQVMTEERDLARSKEEELFDMLASKDEDLINTNEGYVYLTERLQEKEDEVEQLNEQVQKYRESNEKLDERNKELSDEICELRSQSVTLKTKLEEEERRHKSAQDRYMGLLKDGMTTTGGLANMTGTLNSNPPSRPLTGATGTTPPPAKQDGGYEEDFDDA